MHIAQEFGQAKSKEGFFKQFSVKKGTVSHEKRKTHSQQEINSLLCTCED